MHIPGPAKFQVGNQRAALDLPSLLDPSYRIVPFTVYLLLKEYVPVAKNAAFRERVFDTE